MHEAIGPGLRARRTLLARLLGRLPFAWRRRLDLARDRAAFEKLVRARWAPYRRLPLGAAPGGHVGSCTWGSSLAPRPTRGEALQFFWLGYHLLHRFLRAADGAGVELRAVRSVLEIGVGAGRLMRPLRGVEGLRLVGCDVDEASLAWCREHVPGPSYHHNEKEPPLAFARDGEFDLVLSAASLFTSLHPAQLVPWIDEIRRVLRPGGVLICTVLNEHAQARLLTPTERAQVVERGFLVLDPSHPQASETARLAGLVDLYASGAYWRALFDPRFEWLASETLTLQDLVVLRRPEA